MDFGDIFVFLWIGNGKQGEIYGKDSGAVSCAVVDAFIFFLAGDLMCAACYNESECTLCTATEGVDPERKNILEVWVETADGDAFFSHLKSTCIRFWNTSLGGIIFEETYHSGKTFGRQDDCCGRGCQGAA